MQRNWIGNSQGAEIEFLVTGHPGKEFRFFTTRPDTVFGVCSWFWRPSIHSSTK